MTGFLDGRVAPALRLAFCAMWLGLPCPVWSEEPIFELHGFRLAAEQTAPVTPDAGLHQSQDTSVRTFEDSEADWPADTLPEGEFSSLLADGPGSLPPPVNWSDQNHLREVHIQQTPGAYDVVGSMIGADDPNRPRYPYKSDEPWIAHAADPESWGDLAELPYVQLGWFANVESTVYAGRVFGQFKSGSLLDAAFPGDPMHLSIAPLNVSVSPRIEIGYRFERGLGETRFGYQYYDFRGNGTFEGYDQGFDARASSRVVGHVFDLDFCEFEFNPGGLPVIHPLFKFPGRHGLGRPLTPQWMPPPLELRFVMGARGANYFTEAEAVGPFTTDRVVSNFWGGGLHFTWDLNQQIHRDMPVFWHLRADGSGSFGRLDQTFIRRRGITTATGTDPQAWIGVPTVSVEAGLSWAPQLPYRTTRVTLAYHYEQWFAYGQATVSDTNLILNGILLRGEWKY